MASWLWAAPSESTSTSSQPAPPFQSLLDKLTSPLLPSTEQPSLPDCLDLADKIRAKEVPAKVAATAFGRKLTGENANVHMRTLNVLDLAIKNSGDAFITEVSQRPAGAGTRGTGETVVDGLERLALNTKRSDLQENVLLHVQNWALAISSMSKLDNSGAPQKPAPDLVVLYRELKNRGLKFPRPDTSSVAAMVESMSMPEWIESDRCSYCRTGFSLLNRRHHCRNCGDIFCGNCSSKTLPLPHFGVQQPVRVCDKCYKSLKAGKTPQRRNSVPTPSSPDSSAHESSLSRSSTVSHKYHSGGRSKGAGQTRHVRFQEDEDLQRAIALSLAEAEAGSGSHSHEREGYRPGYAEYGAPPRAEQRRPETQAEALARFEKHAKDREQAAVREREGESRKLTKEEEEDPDLKEAIEASLREMESSRPSRPGEAGRVVNGRVSAAGERRVVEWPGQEERWRGEEQTRGQREEEEDYYGGVRPSVPRLPSYDLAATDSDALLTFSQEVDAARSSGHDPRSIRSFYDRAVPVEGKLDHSKASAEGRQQVLKDMNTKLSQAVKLYNDKLEQNVAYRQQYQQPQGYAGYAPQQGYGYQTYPGQPYQQSQPPPPQSWQQPQPQSSGFYPNQPQPHPQYSQPTYSAPPPQAQPSYPYQQQQPPQPAPYQYPSSPAPATIASPPPQPQPQNLPSSPSTNSIYPNLQNLTMASPPPVQVGPPPQQHQQPAYAPQLQGSYFAQPTASVPPQQVQSPNAIQVSAPPLATPGSEVGYAPQQQGYHHQQYEQQYGHQQPVAVNGSHGYTASPVQNGSMALPQQQQQYAPPPTHIEPTQQGLATQPQQAYPPPAQQYANQPQQQQYQQPSQQQREDPVKGYSQTVQTLANLPKAPTGELAWQEQQQQHQEAGLYARREEEALIEL